MKLIISHYILKLDISHLKPCYNIGFTGGTTILIQTSERVPGLKRRIDSSLVYITLSAINGLKLQSFCLAGKKL